MAAKQTPLFMFGDLDRKVYVVTKYKRSIQTGSVIALERHDVTADFVKFVGRMRKEGII